MKKKPKEEEEEKPKLTKRLIEKGKIAKGKISEQIASVKTLTKLVKEDIKPTKKEKMKEFEHLNSEEIVKLKEKYDTPEAFETFIQNFVGECGKKYKGFSEHVLNSYLDEFGDIIARKVIDGKEIEVVCKTEMRGSREVSYCTVVEAGQKPYHLGFEVPPELFKEFSLLAITPLTDEEIRFIKRLSIQKTRITSL